MKPSHQPRHCTKSDNSPQGNYPQSNIQVAKKRAKHDKENYYLMLDNKLISDPELSFKERGLLNYLLSFPDDWFFQIKTIAKDNGVGRDQVYSGIRAIIKQGYGKHRFGRNSKGQIVKSIYEFYEVKQAHSQSKIEDDNLTDHNVQIFIIRAKHDKENPYTMVARSLIRDPNLSFKERGLLSYLFYLPDNWLYNFEKIAKDNGVGKRQVYSGIRAIIKQGYGKHRIVRNPKGQIVKSVYDFSEIKQAHSQSKNALEKN